MSNKLPPEDFGFGFGPDDDPMRKEEQEIKKSLEALNRKMTGATSSPITNRDLLHYMRIINFNFAALSRLIHVIHIRQGIIEESVLDVSKKMTALTETQELLDKVLNDEPDSDHDSTS